MKKYNSIITIYMTMSNETLKKCASATAKRISAEYGSLEYESAIWADNFCRGQLKAYYEMAREMAHEAHDYETAKCLINLYYDYYFDHARKCYDKRRIREVGKKHETL